MAEAVDFSMPDVFANDYLDRIMKKTEKSLNTHVLYQCMYMTKIHDSHTLYSTESRK